MTEMLLKKHVFLLKKYDEFLFESRDFPDLDIFFFRILEELAIYLPVMKEKIEEYSLLEPEG